MAEPIRKHITTPSQIDSAMRYLDGCATKILNSGKTPYMQIGVVEDEAEKERTEKQRKKTHAMVDDIAKQAIFKTPGITVVMSDYDLEESKALLVRWFERECAQINEPYATVREWL